MACVGQQQQQQQQQEFFTQRVSQLPVVSAGFDTAAAWYLRAKEQNEYVRVGLEKIEGSIPAASVYGSLVISNSYVAPSLAKMNEYGLSNLDYIEKNYPVIKDEPAIIYSKASSKLSETMTSVNSTTSKAKEDAYTAAALKVQLAKEKSAKAAESLKTLTADLIEYSRQLEDSTQSQQIKQALQNSLTSVQERLPTMETVQSKRIQISEYCELSIQELTSLLRNTLNKIHLNKEQDEKLQLLRERLVSMVESIKTTETYNNVMGYLDSTQVWDLLAKVTANLVVGRSEEETKVVDAVEISEDVSEDDLPAAPHVSNCSSDDYSSLDGEDTD
eukprot:Awhi_evm1s8541